MPIPLSISRLHMEDTDQIRESREWTERGQGYVNSFRPIYYCLFPASISVAFSFVVRRRSGISYVSAGLALMEWELSLKVSFFRAIY